MEKTTLRPIQKFTCPHCGAISAFDCVFSGFSVAYGSLSPVTVWACHNCDGSVFARDEATQYDQVARNQLHIRETYPANEPQIDNNIPAGIANDFSEAIRCYNVGANKASVVLAGRAIQKACLNLGATKGKKLYQQVEELKLNGKLHPDLAELATEVRILRNDGAHPEDDGLDEIVKDDAKEILDFAKEFFDDLYVRPTKVANMRAKRQAKTQEATV